MVPKIRINHFLKSSVMVGKDRCKSEAIVHTKQRGGSCMRVINSQSEATMMYFHHQGQRFEKFYHLHKGARSTSNRYCQICDNIGDIFHLNIIFRSLNSQAHNHLMLQSNFIQISIVLTIFNVLNNISKFQSLY